MTSIDDIVALLPPPESFRQSVFAFIVKFYELNKCGPTMLEVQEGMSKFYGRPIVKTTIWNTLTWLDSKRVITLVRPKNKRQHLRIVVENAEWKFTGTRNVYLRKSVRLINP